MTVPRRCCRPGCPHYAVATLTFVYTDSTAVIGPLATARDPHSWDLCVGHASRITAPRGWELVRHPGPLVATHPDEEDLVALADAVREGRDGLTTGPSAPGFLPQAGGGTAQPARWGSTRPRGSALTDLGGHDGGARSAERNGGGFATGGQRSGGTGRRRGHLRVLPDPQD